MKNLKPIQRHSFLLLFLFSLVLGSCGETASSVADKAEAIADATGEAASEAVDKVKKAVEDQKITIFERSDNYLDFAHFGHFDLAHWEMKDNPSKTEGDATTKSEMYTNGKSVIEVTHLDMGDHGYSHEQILKDEDGKIWKKRTFKFETDPELKMVEKIYDHHAGLLWSREQKAEKHFASMKERPIAAIGEFKESKMK